MQNNSLIIFDCDGVLVNSESLFKHAQLNLLAEVGINLSLENFNKRFNGLGFEQILKQLEQESEYPISATLLPKFKQNLKEIIKQIKPIENITQAISQLNASFAVGSNSSKAYLENVLGLTDLAKYFGEHIYSAHDTKQQRLKPYPDIYLEIAERFTATPSRTFVIEDSKFGVQAGVAAGFRVIGFTGGDHTYLGHCDDLMDAGAETVIANHKDLPEVISALESWKSPI